MVIEWILHVSSRRQLHIAWQHNVELQYSYISTNMGTRFPLMRFCSVVTFLLCMTHDGGFIRGYFFEREEALLQPQCKSHFMNLILFVPFVRWILSLYQQRNKLSRHAGGQLGARNICWHRSTHNIGKIEFLIVLTCFINLALKNTHKLFCCCWSW